MAYGSLSDGMYGYLGAGSSAQKGASPWAGGTGPGGKYANPENYVGGYGGQSYEGIGKTGYKSVRDMAWSQAAQKILRGASGADAALLEAYRDMYRARLGGAAAGQRQYVDQMGSEAAGQGLSPDLVRRMIAARQASQAQGLSAQQGELMGQYGAQRAGLLQGTGNALAGLQLDQLKWEQNRADAKAAAKKAGQMGALGAVAGIAGAALGGPLGGMLGASMFGGGGGGGYTPGSTVAPGTGPLLNY